MAGQPPFFVIPPVEQTNGAGKLQNQADSTKGKAAGSSRGRKANRAPPTRMKQRKRGFGVAQLEQIINNNTTELNQPMPNPFHHVQVGVPLTVDTSAAFETGSAFHRNPTFGPFWSNPYVFGAPEYSRVLCIGSNYETSNELASMPKLVHHYDHFPSDSFCKGAEVVTVHRKMEAKGRKVFMEYEFFPDKNKDTDFKEVEMVGSQSPKASSCLTTMSDCSAATTTPNSVDLSLKLSF